MSIELFVNATRNPVRNYVGLSPARCVLLVRDEPARRVTLRSAPTPQGGEVVLRETAGASPSDTLALDLPATGGVAFFVAGKFDDATGQAFSSTNDGDAGIEVIDDTTGSSLLVQRLMVRVRKNANNLSDGERDRFLSALVTLNQRGDFVDFQNMHTSDTSREIHGRSCFLPWHRIYLLDLERKLQDIDPSVTLPFWRFDEMAPGLFTEDFIGVPDASGLVQFSNTNPLINWRVTVFGVGSGRIRRAYAPKIDGTAFDPATESAQIQNDQTATLNLGTTGAGTAVRTNFENFERMEGDPHGSAHSSFVGHLADIGRAPADPLFFMLHGNVDRLWALWQWTRDRFDPALTETYYKQGAGPVNPDQARLHADRIGNFINDTLWPWNGIVGAPRPRTAPGTYFPESPFLRVPDRYPDIRSSLDYHGQIDLDRVLGFDYVDVPYEL